MNILHHKSWHVRNKDNIARVRKDEAKAAEEEKKKQDQVKRAEQEIRINYLRSKIHSNDITGQGLDQSTDKFDVFQSQTTIHKTNKEYEKEKKNEQEKYEKQIGLLTYLGKFKDNSVTDSRLKSWYNLPPTNRKINEEICKNEEINAKDEKLKTYYDPLKYYFSNKEKQKKIHETKIKKHNNKKKDIEKNISKSTKFKILRSERLIREGRERERQNILLGKLKK